MIDGMGGDGNNAAAVQPLDLIPVQEGVTTATGRLGGIANPAIGANAPFTPGPSANDVKGGLHAVLLEQFVSVHLVTETVVEGNDQGFGR